ncbi:MAG: DNA-formamidopyrimidine glycosylase family protein [Acidimicrobiales bacterium]
MPELPEIKAHAERLAADWTGAELSAFRVIHLTALKTYDPAPKAAHGRALTGTSNRGKYLQLRFDEPDESLTFVVHLMQGRLRPDEKRAKKPAAAWPDGSSVTVARCCSPSREPSTAPACGSWPVRPTAVSPSITSAPMPTPSPRPSSSPPCRRRTPVHGFLRDQRRIAGIGRLLANEILWAAKLSPFAMTAKLEPDQIDRLREAMAVVIDRHLAFERTLDDIGRSADRPSDVHHRVGLPCRACDDEVRSVEYRRSPSPTARPVRRAGESSPTTPRASSSSEGRELRGDCPERLRCRIRMPISPPIRS